ncbi:NAD-dependent epimerase/dehydratase family protein [Methylobacterium sp. WCS2018Hpa-22]|uniref:NAD-dependent epimerase/dehydratase family protein n=1 Tax=Methylobacterium sp. WCS2018Hpa-22 TaxID=3073633 RepID=UPI00288921EF|nr:NAD-dependent epimerase/dehydratase family protein [Methylobacterium sp. WCS2018Hpa-22]
MSRNVIALTGATGFIGRHLLRSLANQGYRVRVLLRRPVELPPGASGAVVGDLSRPMNMAAALSGVGAIVHSAGLAHAMSGTPEDDYRSSNIEATRRLAEAAAKARVGRFVFLSSIRAQTGISAAGTVTEDNHPNPTDAYGRSKLAAEEALAEIGIDWVALRPVLVYGAGVKGNMAALLRLARTPYPLPLASLTGRRSLISVENLSAAIVTVLRHEGSLGRALVAAEPDALTLPGMIAALRAGLDRRAGLVPCPPSLFGLACRMTGRREIFERLSGDLVAQSKGLSTLGWSPQSTSFQGLAALARTEGAA